MQGVPGTCAPAPESARKLYGIHPPPPDRTSYVSSYKCSREGEAVRRIEPAKTKPGSEMGGTAYTSPAVGLQRAVKDFSWRQVVSDLARGYLGKAKKHRQQLSTIRPKLRHVLSLSLSPPFSTSPGSARYTPTCAQGLQNQMDGPSSRHDMYSVRQSVAWDQAPSDNPRPSLMPSHQTDPPFPTQQRRQQENWWWTVDT